MLDAYTRVLESAASVEDEARADTIVSKLIHHLVSTGRLKMLPQIHTELKTIAARRAALLPVVEVAHEKEKGEALASARAEGISAKKAVVNRSLVSGWRARGGGKLVDHSGKRALLDIYQKVVA